MGKWSEELTQLSAIAVTQPQAAYACYVAGYQHKFSYFMRTIPQLEEYLQPIEDILRNQLIPAITGGKVVSDNERDLLTLPPRLGGLGIKNIVEISPKEHENSISLTQRLQNDLMGRDQDGNNGKSVSQIKSEKNERNKEKLERLKTEMNEEQKRLNGANTMTGTSNWLTNLPIKDLGYDLNKQQFQDALRIRYNWSLSKLPSECICGSKFQITHALSCKKGGFVTQRHNEIRDITAALLSEVCNDVRKEPTLLDLNGEHLAQRSANRSQEARLDISATGFWTPGQRAFFDVRVFDLNAQRYRGTNPEKCFKRNEDETPKPQNPKTPQLKCMVELEVD